MAIIFLLFALLFILPDLYISLILMNGLEWWAHLLVWTPAITALGLLISVRFSGIGAGKMQLFTGLVICIALPQIVFVGCSLIGRLCGLAWPSAPSLGNGIGFGIAVIMALFALYGLTIGWKKLTVKEVELPFPELPAEFDGYKIVQLSDFHIGAHGNNTRFIEKVVNRTNDEHPDLIVFTGDLINLSGDEIKPFEETLKQLQAKDGVISVLGNHDYSLYGMVDRPKDIREGAKSVMEAEWRMGWDLLLNEHCIIFRDNAQIAIVGVENTGKPPFPIIGDLHGAMRGLPDGIFTILLSHDPMHWRLQVLPETDIPLTLSGHTHAAQVKIGRWSPVKWFYPEWGGLYSKGKQKLYVSEGLGGSIPFRLGATPEIIVIKLTNNGSNKDK